MQSILVSGGAGFVGSNLAILFKGHNLDTRVVSFDNLKRRGAELNLHRLAEAGVEFVHGDIRSREDFDGLGKIDLLIDCSAEPSVQVGLDGAPDYMLQTNLVGTLNLLELARKKDAAFIFLSTSRVYPIGALNGLPYTEGESRLIWDHAAEGTGVTREGISEEFPLEGPRSLYGASKLAGEYILQEYAYSYGMPAVVNRCGILTGPWQMGKVDQGVISLWVASHVFGRDLRYIGYGGSGKQVRDVLHVRDLFQLLQLQLKDLKKWDGTPYNVGGGSDISVSLAELTGICQRETGNEIEIRTVRETSAVDIPIYLTDHTRASSDFGWKPRTTVEEIVSDIHSWIVDNRDLLEKIL